MSNQVFQQNLNDKKGPQPGGPYLIQMLFKEPVDMPDKEKMTAVMGKHIGSAECFCYDKKMAGFAALDHIAEFQDGKCPVQLMVMKCDKFKGKGFDEFLLSQMWDCQEDRDRIFRECRYQVVATDMLAAALPALERANLDADFLDALAELYPTCEAFYFQNCGKLFLAEDVRSHQIEGPDRFIRFGVNVRFFTIQGTEDMLIDTVGMSTLFLPDLQYHFHDMDPNWVVNHAYNVASYILANDNPIEDGETVDGVEDGQMSRDVQWKCRYENNVPRYYFLDGHTILIESSLAGKDVNPGRRNFTLMHETCHQIFRMLFPTEYMPPTQYRKVCCCTSAMYGPRIKPTNWEEWRVNTLTAAILMPKELLIEQLHAAGLGERLRLLNKVFAPKEYKAFSTVAEAMGVSKSALAIRMKQLHLLDRDDLKDPYALVRVECDQE